MCFITIILYFIIEIVIKVFYTAQNILIKCYLIKYMKALLSNDDGITASGILASKKAVEDLCDTYVVAPETQQSGIGHALTLYEPLRVNEYTLKDGSKGYGVGGTPTDAVTIALFELMDEKPDIMISGINTGFNIGQAELTTSGTLGAAIEAASFGIPTIAISQEVTRDDIKFENGDIQVDFDFAGKMLNKLTKIGLSERMYNPVIEKRLDPRGKPYYWIDGEPYEAHKSGSDGHALRKLNKTSITPLKIDLTSGMDLIREWFD